MLPVLRNHNTSIKLSNYFEITKQEYTYLKLIPNNSIRNYNSEKIAHVIASLYRNVLQLIKFQQKKFFFKVPCKVSYYIYIEKGVAEFYFIVPSLHVNVLREKIGDTWKGITIQKVDVIPTFKPDSIKYSISTKKEDALSLATDKRTNTLLASTLNCLEVMDHGDRVGIIYNFIPTNQVSWRSEYQNSIKKFQENYPMEKSKGLVYGLKLLGILLLEIVDMFTEVITNKEKPKKNAIEMLFDMNMKKELSASTKSKKDAVVLNTQILLVSESSDKTKAINNAVSVCEAHRSINDDNEIRYNKVNSDININGYSLKGVETFKTSIQECQNFISLPGRELLQSYKNIEKIDVTEAEIPEELTKGYISLGISTYKGNQTEAFMSSDKNLANLGLVLLGPQGSGKSEYIANYCYHAAQKGEGVILLDFIMKCGLSDKIKSVVPADRVVEINLDNFEEVQSFGFNEVNNLICKDENDLLELANMQTQLTLSFINSINPDSELSSRMRRSLSAACNVVFINKDTSLRDVLECMQNHNVRHEYIDKIPLTLKNDFQDDVNNLLDMDQTDKTGAIVGTKDSKIDFILDRVNLLMEDIKLKRMFNKPIKDNLDFVNMMAEGKVVLIKYPDSKFPTKFHKNILTTFFVSKIWLAKQVSGSLYDTPLRTHIIIDEVFQAPTSEKLLLDILPQGRKFQAKFIFSAHYLSQIETIKEALKASGASYMLLQGTDSKNYKEMEVDLKPFEVEDLLNLKRFHSLCMVKYSKGYAKFITALPKPIN